MKTKYKPTILNISVAAYLASLLVLSIIKYETLSSGGGWGFVAIFGLAMVGVAAGIIDYFLQRFIKNTKLLNIVGLIIGIVIATLVILDS